MNIIVIFPDSENNRVRVCFENKTWWSHNTDVGKHWALYFIQVSDTVCGYVALIYRPKCVLWNISTTYSITPLIEGSIKWEGSINKEYFKNFDNVHYNFILTIFWLYSYNTTTTDSFHSQCGPQTPFVLDKQSTSVSNFNGMSWIFS